MAFAPDGRLFVCQQNGQLRVVENGVLLPTSFTTVTVNASGERGLLGVAFDPDFATATNNWYVYVYYTATLPAIHNRVSRFTANGNVAVPGSDVVLLVSVLRATTARAAQRAGQTERDQRQRGWLRNLLNGRSCERELVLGFAAIREQQVQDAHIADAGPSASDREVGRRNERIVGIGDDCPAFEPPNGILQGVGRLAAERARVVVAGERAAAKFRIQPRRLRRQRIVSEAVAAMCAVVGGRERRDRRCRPQTWWRSRCTRCVAGRT